MRTAITDIQSPFTGCYKIELDEARNLVALYSSGQARPWVIEHGRYLKSIEAGRILSLAEYDVLLGYQSKPQIRRTDAGDATRPLYVLTVTTYESEKYVLRNEQDGTEWRGHKTNDVTGENQPRGTWKRNERNKTQPN